MQIATPNSADSGDSQPSTRPSGSQETRSGTTADRAISNGFGGLLSNIVQAGRAVEVAQAAQSAQAKARDDVKSISFALTSIANALHTVTMKLGDAVEGTYASEAGDPRVELLAETLYMARRGDRELAVIAEKLRHLDQSVQSSQSSIGTLEREREMLAMLYRVAQELNSTLDLETVLGRVMDKVIEIVGADRGFLLLYNQSSHQLEYTIARDKQRQPMPKKEYETISTSIIQQVWRTKVPIVTVNAPEDQRIVSKSIHTYDIRSVLCAPLVIQKRNIGIVYVDNRHIANPYTAEHLDLLAACCNQAAIAIDNARKVREITEFKNLLDNIFRSIASGVITLDTKGQIQLLNLAAERIFHLSASDVSGQDFQQVFERLGQDKIIEAVDRAKADDSTILNREVDCELPNRGKVALSINISPLRDQENKETGLVMAVEDLTELRNWRDAATRIKDIFQRYVHPSVVEELMSNPKAVELGGQTKEVSILFADIRGYTALSDGRRSEEVVELLNAYLDILTEEIWKEQGTLTMFQGDALMAIFNAPLPQQDHAVRAVRAALGMRRAIEERQWHNNPDYPEAKYGIRVRYGIGVNTGLATVGNIGSRERLQNYTAMGDAVNIASRLQSNSSDNEIIINHTTYEQVQAYFDCLKLEPLSVKNKREPLTVYKVRGLRGSSSL
ncbi:MAG TPA: adenylate/guanylate cyclase domain-containing protein [Ktedonobacterales bacterium]|jgi:PAS domain S-box-containing protein